jgi:cobalt-precorrin 5A hydrolase
MIGIGIGCRSGASKEAILAIIAQACAKLGLAEASARLFTFDGKRDEAGLIAAAAELKLPLVFVSHDALQSVADKITTRSEAAEKALGLPSVAEAAALVGCGAGAHLLLPRITGEGVTCAIAKGADR